MAEKGDLSKLINGSNVQLLNGSDDWIGIFDIELETTHPETRRDVRKGVAYAHQVPDRGIRFKLLEDTSIVDELETKNTMNSRRVIPVFAWSFKVTADDGTTDTVTLNGKLRDMKRKAPENDFTEAECFIRITDQVI